ncbi:hypothetical protein GPA10_32785 [Streptomyces sp. p1417]|uniref:Putative sensor domain-containing protein n=1 Tax=Streptomyces typhae TaxID=2681492 RepID=A0A6L6X699_9ACTN|nr:hypothetical protein [Streptomyces typhae]
MTIDTLPRTTAPARTRPERAHKGPAFRTSRPGFWRAPFAAPTFRTFGYVLTSLPVAVAGFVFAVTLFSLGAGLAVTLLGLPVFAAMLAGARGLGASERRRARDLLGVVVAGPAPVRGADAEGAWARATGAARGRGGLEGAAVPGRHVPVAGGELRPRGDGLGDRLGAGAVPRVLLGVLALPGLARLPRLRLRLGQRALRVLHRVALAGRGRQRARRPGRPAHAAAAARVDRRGPVGGTGPARPVRPGPRQGGPGRVTAMPPCEPRLPAR